MRTEFEMYPLHRWNTSIALGIFPLETACKEMTVVSGIYLNIKVPNLFHLMFKCFNSIKYIHTHKIFLCSAAISVSVRWSRYCPFRATNNNIFFKKCHRVCKVQWISYSFFIKEDMHPNVFLAPWHQIYILHLCPWWNKCYQFAKAKICTIHTLQWLSETSMQPVYC